MILRHELAVSLRCSARVDGDVPARLDDAVERAAIDDEVTHDRERVRAPRLDGDLVAVLERAHVQLAGRRDLGAVRHARDHETAHAADAFTAVGVERDRLDAVGLQLLVEHVEHLEERHVVADVTDRVGLETPSGGRVVLTPDLECEIHL